MDLKQKEIFDVLEKIIIKNRNELDNFHTYAENKKHNDIGIEGWLQFELIAKLTEKDINVDHKSKDADLHFIDREDIELRASTSFNPCYVLDGLIYHKSQSPVLFFSGYNELFKEINKPGNYSDEEYVFKSFIHYLKDERKRNLKSKSIGLEYKVIKLKKHCIIGLLSKSNNPTFEKN